MSFNETLADRVREMLSRYRPVEETPMFGGLAFKVRLHVTCCVVGDDLMVRMDPDKVEEALERPGARLTDVAGRPMTGMLFVGKEGTRTRPRLKRWVQDAAAFTATLPVRRS